MSPRSLRSPERTDRDRNITDILRDPAALASIPPGGIPLSRVARVPSVTSLPAAVVATDGMEVYYTADDTNGIVWHLRYCAAETTYKWRYVGGAPLFAEVTTTETTTSASYTDMTTTGPSLTVPLAGDYIVIIAANMYQTTGGLGYMSYAIGGTAASDAESIAESSLATGIYGTHTRRKTGLAAGTALVAKYKTTANTLNANDRTMVVIPVRVI